MKLIDFARARLKEKFVAWNGRLHPRDYQPPTGQQRITVSGGGVIGSSRTLRPGEREPTTEELLRNGIGLLL